MLDPAIVAVAMLLGAIVGSFVGGAVLRVPRGETIVYGRSRCDDCGATLAAYELIPIVSFAIQRGRCRRCNAPIAVDQPLAETGCALTACVAVMSAATLSGALLLALFGFTLVALALLDARYLWLPDRLTLPLIAVGLVSVLALPAISITDRGLGVAIGYLLLETLRLGYQAVRGIEGLGAGDAKLFAAIGAWLGVRALAPVLLVACLLAFAYLGWRMMRGGRLEATTRLPLGTCLTLAAMLVLPVRMSFDSSFAV